jgi:large subunit ribosomal protein L30
MAKLKITQVRSTIGYNQKHRRTIEALGLGRIRKSVIHTDTPQIRGMVRAVGFLLEVEEVSS